MGWECPTSLRSEGFPALRIAFEAISRNDSWAGGPGPLQPQRQSSPRLQGSSGHSAARALGVQEGEKAIRIPITMNT